MQKNRLLILAISTLWVGSLAAQVLINDNFDTYTLGAVGPQATHWTTWTPNSTSEEAIVSDDVAYSGSHSLKIYGQGGPVDALLLLGNQTSGHFRLAFKMFVVQGSAAYFNHQKDQTNPGGFWGQEIAFEVDGSGDMDAGAASAAQFSYRQGTWINYIQFFDLDNKRTTVIIDNQIIYSWDVSLSSQGTSAAFTQLGAFDFYGRSNAPHLFYLDDVRFEQLPSMAAAGVIAKLEVDMAEVLNTGGSINAAGMRVAGSFNGWNTDSTHLMDNGDSTFTQFIPLAQFSTVQYKFLNGNTWAGEESVPMACGVSNGLGGYNRELGTFFTDTTAATICFGACVVCDSLNVPTFAPQQPLQLALFPNPATDFTELNFQFERPTDFTLTLFNALGEAVHTDRIAAAWQGTARIPADQLAAGVYWLVVQTDAQRSTRQLVVVRD